MNNEPLEPGRTVEAHNGEIAVPSTPKGNEAAVSPIKQHDGSFEGIDLSTRAFDKPKKRKFIELARNFWKEHHIVPKPEDLCDVLDIGIATFYRHLKSDSEFSLGWYEITLLGKGELEHVMYSNAKRPNGYMDRITWLRRHFPEEYNPQQKVQVSGTDAVEKLFDALKSDAVDAQIVDNRNNER